MKKYFTLIAIFYFFSNQAYGYRVLEEKITSGCHYYEYLYFNTNEEAYSKCRADGGYCGNASTALNFPPRTVDAFERGWVFEKDDSSPCSTGYQDPATGSLVSYQVSIVLYYYIGPYQILTPAPTNNSCPTVGNPIAVTEGKKIDRFIDLSNRGVDFIRYYDSQASTTNSRIGNNFRHNFDVQISTKQRSLDFEKSLAGYIKKIHSNPDYINSNHPLSISFRQHALRGYSASSVCQNGVNSLKSTFRSGAFNSSSFVGVSNTDGTCDLKKQATGEVFAKFNISPITDVEVNNSSDIIKINLPDGREFSFEDKDNQFIPFGQSAAKLSSSGEYLVFTYPDGVIDSFKNGRLYSRMLTNGKILNLKYSADYDLEEIVDENGTLFGFEYDESGLVSIVRSAGVIVGYDYKNNYTLESVKYNDMLSQKYFYEDARFQNSLTGIQDANGVRYASWEYDSQGRAISSEHASGAEKVLIDYTLYDFLESPLITVKNALNKSTVYHFDYVSGERKVVRVEGHASENCAAANQSYSYFNNGTLQTQTDWQGNVTLYERDTLGRVTKKTEALKWPASPQYGVNVETSILQNTADTKVTQTCWHTTHNKPEKIIEPATVTTFEYFDNGQLKSKKTQPRNATNTACAA